MQKGLRLSSCSFPGIVWSVITVEEWTDEAEQSKGLRVAVRPSAVHDMQGRIHP
jgi:hypothetical protein